ncbi:uncharacterized protein HKW66_Vig0142340 [Vigna angularis]|uniref:Uncharacterized protein n=1 Tax=Phaseolus angularis TaxID=3914 RepID=A0A8T0KCI0_PHAAN|nr:uncharacterized protein HKW66_Vig0142340 [Vigna angularis]
MKGMEAASVDCKEISYSFGDSKGSAHPFSATSILVISEDGTLSRRVWGETELLDASEDEIELLDVFEGKTKLLYVFRSESELLDESEDEIELLDVFGSETEMLDVESSRDAKLSGGVIELFGTSDSGLWIRF